MESVWKINNRTYDDRQLVDSILADDGRVVNHFFFKKCEPLFRDIHSRFYTDCLDWRELASEFYLYIIYETEQNRTDNHANSKLAGFGFNCKFVHWVKIVLLNYCRQAYKKKADFDDNFDITSDRIDLEDDSFKSTLSNLHMKDIEQLLDSMQPKRYGTLLKSVYFDGLSYSETAEMLGVKMSNFYNLHLRAQNHFVEVLKREGML